MKFFAIAAIALGAAAAFSFFALWAGNGLPYQDPTPEMLKSQDLLANIYVAGMLLGVLLASLGGAALWSLRRRLKRRPS